MELQDNKHANNEGDWLSSIEAALYPSPARLRWRQCTLEVDLGAAAGAEVDKTLNRLAAALSLSGRWGAVRIIRSSRGHGTGVGDHHAER